MNARRRRLLNPTIGIRNLFDRNGLFSQSPDYSGLFDQAVAAASMHFDRNLAVRYGELFGILVTPVKDTCFPTYFSRSVWEDKFEMSTGARAHPTE